MNFMLSVIAKIKYGQKSPEDFKRPAAVFLAVCLVFASIAFNMRVVHADAVTLSSDSITLYVGNMNSTTVLTAQVYPENASVREVEWESSDNSVATVEDGIVTAVAEGEAVISAISADGEAQAECSVVVGKGVTAIAFEQEEIVMYAEGAPMMLTPVITPSDATNKSFVWTSSDYDVVSVDEMGGITPRSAGVAVIGASSVEGKVTAACTVYVLEAQSQDALPESIIDISAQKAMGKGTFVNYLPISKTLDAMLDIQCSFYNVIYNSSSAVASSSDVAQYVNPQNYIEGDARYQFLDLSVVNNLTPEYLNKYLKGKGILSGMGQAFSDAANENGVSEAYLVAHACLETGNGTSQLAKGVEYNGVVVYNMFGIGAYDSNALKGGAAYAYSQGWTSPEAAIKGGAAWIAKNYIYRSSSRQNTLYKMRWNPLSPGTHQYATDVGWAVKQAYTIAKIIGDADCLQIFEIPLYSGTYSGYVPDIVPPGLISQAEESAAEPETEDSAQEQSGEDEAQADDEAAPPSASPQEEAGEQTLKELLSEQAEDSQSENGGVDESDDAPSPEPSDAPDAPLPDESNADLPQTNESN